jgi:hypothetical protein
MISALEAKQRALASSPTFRRDMDAIEAAIKSAADHGEFDIYVTDICDSNRDVYAKELRDNGYSPVYSIGPGGRPGMTIKWL